MNYYQKNRKKILIQCKEYRLKNRQLINDRRKLFKEEVLSKYGKHCQCCGESNPVFLTIDHVGGDGGTHRKSCGIASGNQTYRWLKRNNYPPGFQILCYNCNLAKSRDGICPHKKEG